MSWECNVKGAPGTRAARCGPETAAVLLHDTLADIETETESGKLPVIDIGAAVEPLEEVREISSRYPNPVVGHREIGHARLTPDPHLHLTVGKTILDLVFDEIIQELGEPRAIVSSYNRIIRF